MTEALPPIRYTKAAGDVNIAYRVLGDGPLDLVWVPGLFSNLEIEWEHPFYLRLYRRLAAFSRLMVFDKRGMGLSDRNVGAPTLEERMDDVRAVMDEVGSERAALIGVSEGGPMSMLFAATYPERTTALVLYGTLARPRRDHDYDLGNEDEFVELHRIFDEGWGSGASMLLFTRSAMGHEPTREFVARMERAAGSPGTMRAFLDTLGDIDVRSVIPTIAAPTLVVHALDDHVVPVANGRWLAEHIPGARLIEIPGEHMLFDVDLLADEIETFLTGTRQAVTTDRVLATVLFSDIVASTERASSLGDRRWRELLDDHDALISRAVDAHRGRVVKSTGDGILATFDGPARGVSCGCHIRDSVRSLGIDVRVGLHTGEIEVRGDDIGGVAVHIGQRVSALAKPGEVLVSRTVTDLVAGSGIQFVDRGKHKLKGVPGTWGLHAVAS